MDICVVLYKSQTMVDVTRQETRDQRDQKYGIFKVVSYQLTTDDWLLTTDYSQLATHHRPL